MTRQTPDLEQHLDDLLVRPFPTPGPLVALAYRELDVAVTGDETQREALGPPEHLPRPWDPATCRDPKLRAELWEWLDDVVTWLNHEYTWDLIDLVPPCWPAHAHLVRELAVLADQYRDATRALDSRGHEEWHRYTLPSFYDRMARRLRSHCEPDHTGWPGRARAAEHTNSQTVERRDRRYQADTDAAHQLAQDPAPPLGRPRLSLVDDELTIDLHTGEVWDDG